MTARNLELHADLLESAAIAAPVATTDMQAGAIGVPALPAVDLRHVGPGQWDSIAAGYDDILPDQTGAFNCGNWGRRNVECVEFHSGGMPIGGAVLIVRRLAVLGTGIAVLKWGPVGGWLKAFDADRYMAVIRALQAEYCEKRNMHLTIIPPALPELIPQAGDTLVKLGFKPGASFPDPSRYLVNTNQDPGQLMAGLDQKWRYNLRKARDHQFDIRFADDAGGLAKFLELYRKMIERKQFAASSAIDSLEEFMAASDRSLKPSIVLVSHEGAVTAGGVFFIGSGLTSYMYGATDERALPLNAGYALHWWVAEHLCRLPGMKWYDLGGNEMNGGLHQFKKGMVGKTGSIVTAPPRYHIANGTLPALCGAAAFQARDALLAAKRKLHDRLKGA